MKKIFSTMCASVLGASVAFTGLLPATAAPVYVPNTQTLQHSAAQSDVIQVQRKKKRRYSERRGKRHYRNNRHTSRGFYRDRDRAYYNGHRGYRYHRRGYRNHNGWWFPAGAFVAGAIIGGAISNNNDRVYSGGGSAHVRWCYNRYRSYRDYDNTFQPYNGPRRQCNSPYG